MGKHSAPRKVTENSDYVAMMQRMIRGLETRAIDDPAMLAQVLMLAQRLAEIPNVVIATSSVRYGQDPFSSPSMGEIAKLLGMTKQSASDRRKIGDRILTDRMIGEESIPARERAARTRAARHADTTLTGWLTRKNSAV